MFIHEYVKIIFIRLEVMKNKMEKRKQSSR